MRYFITIGLLILSNVFMTVAWYGHLKFSQWKTFEKVGMVGIVLISWGIALFEYFAQVPANKLGYKNNGGPFTLLQLKMLQEVLSLSVFVIFTLLVFKTETFKWNHLIGALFLLLSVFFFFKK